MPLSDRQRAALSTLEWLLNPTIRAEGKTMAIAIATVRVAARNPGVAIPYFDHSRQSAGRFAAISRAIQMLTEGDVRLGPFTTLSDTALLLRIPRPIPAWEPEEDSLGSLPARQAGLRAGQRFADFAPTVNFEGGAAAIDRITDALRDTLNQTLQDFRTQTGAASMAEVRRLNEMRARQEQIPEDIDMGEIMEAVLRTATPEAPAPEAFKKPVKAKPPKPPPVPRSAWERLLDDEEPEKS